MTNYYDPYDPIFYANEALILLENCLGMAGRVHRGFDEERRSVNRGSTIEIRKPSTLITQAGGTGVAQALNTQKTTILMDEWREVKFELTDQELAYTGDRIITEHISPAVYALASYIESKLVGLHKFVPWSFDIDVGDTFAVADILAARKVLRDNVGSLLDRDVCHWGVDTTCEALLLGLTLFHDASKAPESTMGRLYGHLGQRFGIEYFVQQGYAQHASGTVVSAGTDRVGALAGPVSLRDETISVDSFDGLAETIKAGDSFSIAGDDQRYVVTEDVTLSSGAGTLKIFPPAKVAFDTDDVSGGVAVTFETPSATEGAENYADAYNPSLMFHRNAFALALAPLPEIGSGVGARMSTVVDPRTGLSMRARVAYDDTDAAVVVTLDVLFGVKCLDPNLALVVRRDA